MSLKYELAWQDLRRLREHLKTYEPTLAGLEYKYNIAMKEKSMARLQVNNYLAEM